MVAVNFSPVLAWKRGVCTALERLRNFWNCVWEYNCIAFQYSTGQGENSFESCHWSKLRCIASIKINMEFVRFIWKICFVYIKLMFRYIALNKTGIWILSLLYPLWQLEYLKIHDSYLWFLLFSWIILILWPEGVPSFNELKGLRPWFPEAFFTVTMVSCPSLWALGLEEQ